MPEPSKLSFKGPAERVVIFVADGLRARSFYAPNAAPYLHHVGKDKGVLGLCYLVIVFIERKGDGGGGVSFHSCHSFKRSSCKHTDT